MTEFRADLHCHSTCSDGSDSPEQIISLAKQIGLSGLSITDHDSIASYAIAVPKAEEAGIKLISGVEFSTVHKGNSVHLLSYGFSLNDPRIAAFCERHHERRTNRNREILAKLTQAGMEITEEEIENTIPPELRNKRRTIGRPHIAYVMMQKGYVPTIADAFKRYLAEGKSCFSPGEPVSTEETLALIKETKGLAIIAHPHLIEEAHTLHDLLQMPFDGIECYYARFAMDLQQRWLKIAKKRNWIITGGSDYHGTIKPNIHLGSSWVNEELFNVLWNHYQNQK